MAWQQDSTPTCAVGHELEKARERETSRENWQSLLYPSPIHVPAHAHALVHAHAHARVQLQAYSGGSKQQQPNRLS